MYNDVNTWKETSMYEHKTHFSEAQVETETETAKSPQRDICDCLWRNSLEDGGVSSAKEISNENSFNYIGNNYGYGNFR